MATLKISDLSVGDWVQDKNGIYAKVLGMENWTEGYFLNIELHGVNVGVTPLASVHPIPITPEILESNGWKCNEEDECMKYYGDPTSGIAHTKGTYRYRLETPEASVACYFVHQLQHALRLARVDKEIVMPKKMKTKYNIGDEVWHRFIGNNIKTTVRDIKIDYKGVPTYYCDFYSTRAAFREEELFPTKEELLKSL